MRKDVPEPTGCERFISERAGCEHTDDHREVGWGTRKHFKAHGRFVAHRSKRMHGELVFALLVLKTLGGMYFEMHKQFISERAGCEHTDDHREVGWGTRKHFKAHGRFVAHRSKRMHGELVFALLVQKTLGGMYFEMHKQFISQRAGCEHTDDHREVGWGARKHFKVHALSTLSSM